MSLNEISNEIANGTFRYLLHEQYYVVICNEVCEIKLKFATRNVNRFS